MGAEGPRPMAPKQIQRAQTQYHVSWEQSAPGRGAKTRAFFCQGSRVFKLHLPEARSPETGRVFCLENTVPQTIWLPSHSARDKRRMFFFSAHLAAAPLAIGRKPEKHRQYLVASMLSSRRIIPRTSSMLHDRETERSPQRWVHVWSEAKARRPVNGQIGHALIMMSARYKPSSHLNCSWRYSRAITLERVRQRCSPARRLLWGIICCPLPLAPAVIRREELWASPCRRSATECFS